MRESLSLPWRARFELTDMGEIHQAYRAAGSSMRGQVFVANGIPRKLADGELTSCPQCCTFPCSCEGYDDA